MGSLCNSLLLAVLLMSIAVEGTQADVVVSGSVFCDQCKDGRWSLFDYPLNGVNVALVCADQGGAEKVLMQETSNLVGAYSMRLKGSPDMRRCFARVVGSPQGNWCTASAGPARSLSPSVSMFGVSFYTVDSLLLQPARPMSFCPKSLNPRPAHPVFPAIPPLPFLQPSACPSRFWLMPGNRCNWRVVGPQTKVALAFGLAAAQKYGTDMTLGQGLLGRGELYRTLLREATTALLNSYNSIQFEYPTLRVLWDMNQALQGTPRQAIRQALRFSRANAGSRNVTCRLAACH
ncbi:uncharacterized protein LOC116248339 [Nymphaea colorata]|nr:uncharacterized protein LOC116248339 [Nymphaea colorata]